MSVLYRAEEVVQTDVGQFIHDAGTGALFLVLFVLVPLVLWANFGPRGNDEEGEE